MESVCFAITANIHRNRSHFKRNTQHRSQCSVREEGRAFLITFEDAIRVGLKHRKTLVHCLWIAACLGLLFSLIQPVKFRAKGSFQEGGVFSSSPSFSQLLITGFNGKKENS